MSSPTSFLFPYFPDRVWQRLVYIAHLSCVKPRPLLCSMPNLRVGIDLEAVSSSSLILESLTRRLPPSSLPANPYRKPPQAPRS